MAKKLTDKHPTDKKFRLLEDFNNNTHSFFILLSIILSF